MGGRLPAMLHKSIFGLRLGERVLVGVGEIEVVDAENGGRERMRR